jgi:hypothetical protein
VCPFGFLINASLDANCDQEQVFSYWRFKEPSKAGLVSFQRTAASCERETDTQDASVQKEANTLTPKTLVASHTNTTQHPELQS